MVRGWLLKGSLFGVCAVGLLGCRSTKPQWVEWAVVNPRQAIRFAAVRGNRVWLPKRGHYQTVSDAVADLKDANPRVRARAARVIGDRFGRTHYGRSGAASAVPALTDGLQDKDPQVRENCAYALGRIGPPAVPGLVKGLDHWDVNIRRQFTRALAYTYVGTDPAHFRPSMATPRWKPEWIKAAVAGLRRSLEDVDVDVRLASAFTLGLMGNKAKAALPELVRATTDPDVRVAKQAAAALGRLGVSSEMAVKALTDYLEGPPKNLRKGLIELDDPTKKKAMRWYVALGLVGVTSGGKVRIPLMGRLINEGSGSSRWAGAENARSVVHRLADQVINNGDWRARRAAAIALGELGYTNSYRVRESLGRASKDHDPRVRAAAGEALNKAKRGTKNTRRF